MKISTQIGLIEKIARSGFISIGLILALTCSRPITVLGAEPNTNFATPQEAADALAAAVKAEDPVALRAMFGPDLAEIENPDRVQATNEFKAFAAKLQEGYRVTQVSPAKYEVEVGPSAWPFAIPIVQRAGRWSFDTAAGIEELLNRRIGNNELSALETMRAYVDAQRQYASSDRDGDEVLEYAQKVISSPGKKDGLYWPITQDGERSPFGPLVAEAQAGGYVVSKDLSPKPFEGYWFKILTRQGTHAPGGKYDYIINGNMIGGFAMVAWPADYGNSGVMTFIVNQQGRVYQKDLGKKTDSVVRKMNEYDPDKSWRLSPD